MKIGLLSDTHSHIDEQIINHLNTCDEIWHAGDIGSIDVLEQLQSIGEFKGVYGNIDGKDIRSQLPEYQLLTRDNLKVLMLHIGGKPKKYTKRAKELISQYNPKVFLCGHSHILKVAKDSEHDLLHINPGACGQHGFHTMRTMITFEISDETITNLKVIELGKRGRIAK